MKPAMRFNRHFTTHAWLLSLLLVLPGLAQITDIRVDTTSTQAVFSYTVATSDVCTIQVSEAGAPQVVHDVNPTLFPGADLDTRPGTLRDGNRRITVIGKRAAEKASNGRRYSRALQMDTPHSYFMGCGSFNTSGTFRTTNLPTGLTYVEPVPVDPLNPGEYAYPDLDWTDRSQRIVDPITGILLRRMTMPNDALEERGYFSVPVALALGPSWSNVNSIMVDDSSAAVSTGTGTDWLFLDLNQRRPYYGGTHSENQFSLNKVRLALNAWCGSTGCATAPAASRTLQMCLTLDGVSCITPILEHELASCTANCTGETFRFEVGDSQPILASWFGTSIPNFDLAEAQVREGTVNRNGTQVEVVSGNRFLIRWAAGSRITIGSTTYTIASIENEGRLTLASAPAGTETNVAFSAANFGVMVRKKVSNAETFHLQFARSYIERGGVSLFWNAGGSAESVGNCSYALAPGPNGESGWRCHVSGALYWVGKDSGDVIHLGVLNIPSRSGPDGWKADYRSAAFVDKLDPSKIYAVIGDNANGYSIIRGTYQGSNQPVAEGGIYDTMRECSANPQPCWIFENLTPSSTGQSLTQQLAAFHPDFGAFKVNRVELLSMMGTRPAMQILLRRDIAANDLLAFLAVFDLSTNRVAAAHASWRYWPTRWSPLHGGDDIGDPNFINVPASHFRGPTSGTEYVAGNGPYYSTITSGPVTSQGQPCPARPSDSPIPASEWPVGNRCLTFTVDGEPGDPTPFLINVGTVTTSGTTVTGQGTAWLPAYSGTQMKIGNAFYQFTYVSATQGILNPAPPAVSNSPYSLFLEPVNNPKVGNPDFAYLQDVEVRDIFCATNVYYGVLNACGFYTQTEYFRVIVKNGNTWTVERGWPNNSTPPQPYLPLAANATLFAMPGSCSYRSDFPCPALNAAALWNTTDDPYGTNPTGNTVRTLRLEGAGHSYLRPGSSGNGVADTCEAIDGDYYRCYNIRVGVLPGVLDMPDLRVAMNPPFAGRTGVGSPNSVETHPSHPNAFPRLGEPDYFFDGRPFNGDGNFTGTANSQGTRLSGDLYKFTPAQLPRMRPKFMPTTANCGVNPLLDISGPGATITGAPSHAYRYCLANAPGECQAGSQTGELFVNCPQISRPYCEYPGVAVSAADLRDICIGDKGGNTMAITQTIAWKQDLPGKYTRALTHGLARYKWFDVFWNAKGTPDGRWIFFRSYFANGVRTETLMAKVPPLPPIDSINRADFIKVDERVGKPGPGVNNVIVDFGYDLQFRCSSRNEGCAQGSNAEHRYWSEGVTGVPCTNGCTVSVPAISQHVLYYRVRYRDAANQTLGFGPTKVKAMP